MSRCNGSERAAVAENHLFAIAFTQCRQAAQVAQYSESDLDSLLPASAVNLMEVIQCHRSPHLTHGRAERPRRHTTRNGCHEVVEQRSVFFREDMFRLGTKPISSVRFARTGPGPPQLNQSVTLQTNEM